MKNICRIVMFFSLIFIISCNPKVSTSLVKSYTPLDYKQEVVVFTTDQNEPEQSEVLGEIKIGDTGFSTNCNYEIVIDRAKMEARKVGGNAIKIIEHKPPTVMGSSCHRIKANILKVENIENYIPVDDEKIISDADYAILNVYRYGGAGALVNYDLHLGDSVICKVKNNYKTTLYIKKDGLNTLWAKTEAKSEVPVNIKMGRTYYLRCSIIMGAFVGRPHLELIEYKKGKAEFESFKAKNQ